MILDTTSNGRPPEDAVDVGSARLALEVTRERLPVARVPPAREVLALLGADPGVVEHQPRAASLRPELDAHQAVLAGRPPGDAPGLDDALAVDRLDRAALDLSAEARERAAGG